MGGNNEIPEENAMHILNDLSRGKQQLVQLMTQLITSTRANQNHVGNNGARGSNGNSAPGGSHGKNGNHAEGNNNNIPTKKHTRTTNRVTPRPLFP
jgi:hypothetical protein